jgi:hypothetical protein
MCYLLERYNVWLNEISVLALRVIEKAPIRKIHLTFTGTPESLPWVIHKFILSITEEILFKSAGNTMFISMLASLKDVCK